MNNLEFILTDANVVVNHTEYEVFVKDTYKEFIVNQLIPHYKNWSNIGFKTANITHSKTGEFRTIAISEILTLLDNICYKAAFKPSFKEFIAANIK